MLKLSMLIPFILYTPRASNFHDKDRGFDKIEETQENNSPIVISRIQGEPHNLTLLLYPLLRSPK